MLKSRRVAGFGAIFTLLCQLGCQTPPPAHPYDVVDRFRGAPEDRAVIVFIQPYHLMGQYFSNLYLEEQYAGTLGPDARLSIVVKPGTHRFMVIGENLDFMEARVEAGKTYHVRIRAYFRVIAKAGAQPYFGFFDLVPLNDQTSEIRDLYDQSEEVKSNASGIAFGAQSLERKGKRIEDALRAWEANPERQILHTATSH
jgi:hypothetical protein